MKKKIVPFVLCIFLALLYAGCQKEVVNPFPGMSNSSDNINAAVSGRVVDENKIPVSGASVKIENATTTTDVNGKFSFTSASVNKNAGYVRIEKNGYFLGSRIFVTGANNYVEIELITKKLSGNFSATSGGTITTNNNASIQFTANSIINEQTKTAYSGEVSVSAFLINPTAANFATIMPGDLRGINAGNQEVGLQSFGMMAIELTGANKEKLNLATGKTATISVPIPAALLSQAPATIPLWYFDETKGLWKEEGSATKQGSTYVGTVSHFSFWNLDAPFPLIDFELEVKDKSGNPFPFSKVEFKLTGDSAQTSGSGYTNALGKINGKIPANKELKLNIYDQCKQIVHTQNVNLSSNTNFGVIAVSNSFASVTFSGILKNCANNAVSNGFVNVLVNGNNYRAQVNNGNYSIALPACGGGAVNATLYGFNVDSNTVSNQIMVTANAGTVSTNNLTACTSVGGQYINYSFGGNNYSLATPIDTLVFSGTSNMTNIIGAVKSNYSFKNINLNFGGITSLGTYAVNNFTLSNSGIGYTKSGSMSVTILEYGTPGTYVGGTFSGNILRDSTSAPLIPITGTFRVIRY